VFTQLTAWGVLFYSLPVLQGSIGADSTWSLGQMAAALVSVAIGPQLDRHGPRWPMTLGSLGAVGAVTVVAAATNPRVVHDRAGC
jgi:hypothetical protein